jgi:hypothetical protein
MPAPPGWTWPKCSAGVFVAALAFAVVAMAAIILMEERPLHGPAAKVAPPVVPDAAPAE